VATDTKTDHGVPYLNKEKKRTLEEQKGQRPGKCGFRKERVLEYTDLFARKKKTSKHKAKRDPKKHNEREQRDQRGRGWPGKHSLLGGNVGGQKGGKNPWGFPKNIETWPWGGLKSACGGEGPPEKGEKRKLLDSGGVKSIPKFVMKMGFYKGHGKGPWA